jgi:DNA helicase-2/ATP-dependent DNA helicase PcrA
MIDYSGLNPEQYEAVFSDRDRILCLAGAGTGKTQVLTRRVARLWEAGINPNNMLALTFTRAAGAEMKERVIGLIGEHGKFLFCNTFHAFAVEVIREYADRLGYEPTFTIYDQTECDDLLKEVLADLRLKISAKKVTEARAGKTADMTPKDRGAALGAVKEYEYRLRRNNAFDFDGLIQTLKRAINDDAEIHAALRSRYRYVFVDEFQDTDPEQWAIVQSIAPDNLFIVGDDFQSIYGFRGSDITIILGLDGNPDWQTVKLERNYRSTQPIIEAANALIKHNTQTEKSLTTDKPGLDIDYREPEDDNTEITEIIPRLLDNQRTAAWATTAILCRTNKQLDNAKAILTAHGVPCETLTAADNPLSSPGAKELLAWIAAIENPSDDAAIRRIAATKMSKAGVLEAEQVQLNGSGSLAEALRNTEAGIAFLDYINEQSQAFISSKDTTTGAAWLSESLGIYADQAIDEITRWQQRQDKLGEPTTAAALLDYVRLSNVADKPAKERDHTKTYLMTVHGSKGLEFDEVFIIGAAQGAFPNRGNLQEERRLFYVAITRAREYLNISRPLTMADWGGNQRPTERSQFISEAINI